MSNYWARVVPSVPSPLRASLIAINIAVGKLRLQNFHFCMLGSTSARHWRLVSVPKLLEGLFLLFVWTEAVALLLGIRVALEPICFDVGLNWARASELRKANRNCFVGRCPALSSQLASFEKCDAPWGSKCLRLPHGGRSSSRISVERLESSSHFD